MHGSSLRRQLMCWNPSQQQYLSTCRMHIFVKQPLVMLLLSALHTVCTEGKSEESRQKATSEEIAMTV